MDTPVELSLKDLQQASSIPENASQTVAEYSKSNHQGDSQLPEEDPLRLQESLGEQDFEVATENASQSVDEYPSNHQGGSHVPEEEPLRSQESLGEQDYKKGASQSVAEYPSNYQASRHVSEEYPLRSRESLGEQELEK